MRVFAVLLSTVVIGFGASPLVGFAATCNIQGFDECMGNFTCDVNGTCKGDPINEGQPCTQNNNPCSTQAVCRRGICTGTQPSENNAPCNYAGLEKCYAPGHCMTIPNTNTSFCIQGAPKTCPPSSDPCKISVCNPADGNCVEGDKCFTFFGCETCSNGTCQIVNEGQACANPEGDFNDCTTNDQCVSQNIGAALTALAPPNDPRLPPALMAALSGDGEGEALRGVCAGVPGVSTPLPGATPTPTVGSTSCVG